LALNSFGAPTVGDFLSDSGNAGANYSSSESVNIANADLPAPAEVYQTERFGSNFTYTVSGLAPNSETLLRLHFAEIYFSTIGKRVFDVSHNGTLLLDDYDILTSVGKNVAIVEEFEVLSDQNGQVTLSFTSSVNNAKISAIEVFH